MIRPELIQTLREEAEAYARKILKDQVYFSSKSFESKENTVKKFKRSKHVLLKQSDIDHCVNNNMDVMYLYDKLLSKYGNDIDKPKKKYYVSNGGKRGRPKKNTNEQEQ